MSKAAPFAEVVETSLSTWKMQSWQWNDFPPFGSLIAIPSGDRIIFGLVYHIQTGSLDVHRTVFAYKKTEEELLRDQPQIFEFLQTTFSCITVGYIENNDLWYQFSPEPPQIHSFGYYATEAQLAQFFSEHHYLPILFSNSSLQSLIDELLLTILKQLQKSNLLNSVRFRKFIETFSLLTANDYRRLKLFLQRAHTIINPIS